MAPATARRRGDGGAAVLRQGFAKHYGGGGDVGEGEGGNQRCERKALPPVTPLHILVLRSALRSPAGNHAARPPPRRHAAGALPQLLLSPY